MWRRCSHRSSVRLVSGGGKWGGDPPARRLVDFSFSFLLHWQVILALFVRVLPARLVGFLFVC